MRATATATLTWPALLQAAADDDAGGSRRPAPPLSDEALMDRVSGGDSDAFARLYERYAGPLFNFLLRMTRQRALAEDLLGLMAGEGADFTNTFRALSAVAGEGGEAEAAFVGLFMDVAAVRAWLARWRARLEQERRGQGERIAAMKATNPAIIARNHQVEKAIAAGYDGEFAPFQALTEALGEPFADRAPGDPLTLPPEPHEVVHQTFCGT